MEGKSYYGWRKSKMEIRRIGGLQFALVGRHRLKKAAQEEAQSIRRNGYNARVIKSGKIWQVWREVV